MHYDVPPRRRSFGSVLLVLFLLGFMFLAGIVVIGVGALVFMRARVHQAQAMVERDVAMQFAEQARAQAEHAQSQAQAELDRAIAEVHGSLTAPPLAEAGSAAAMSGMTLPESPEVAGSIRIANREVAVQIDAEGKLQLDGTACELPQLKERLQQAGQGREQELVVVVKADKRCVFEHVAAVLAVCKELNLPHVRIVAQGE